MLALVCEGKIRELICQQALAWHAGNFNVARKYPIELKPDSITIAQRPRIRPVALWMGARLDMDLETPRHFVRRLFTYVGVGIALRC